MLLAHHTQEQRVHDALKGIPAFATAPNALLLLLIRAITHVIKPVFNQSLSRDCLHLSGNGGAKAAVAQLQSTMQQYPDRQIIKSDVKGYYAHIVRVEMHPDKTFIGNVSKGVDFLGFHCHPLGMTLAETTTSRHEQKLAQLYERGASSQRIAAYRLRWSSWAFMPLLRQLIKQSVVTVPRNFLQPLIFVFLSFKSSHY